MDLSAKLQLTPDQAMQQVGAPATGVPALDGVGTPGGGSEPGAVLVFVNDRATLEKRRAQIAKAAGADRLTWVAYPKAGKLGTDLNRDSLAALLGENGIQPVRQVAIDEVWSALRFRPG